MVFQCEIYKGTIMINSLYIHTYVVVVGSERTDNQIQLNTGNIYKYIHEMNASNAKIYALQGNCLLRN